MEISIKFEGNGSCQIVWLIARIQYGLTGIKRAYSPQKSPHPALLKGRREKMKSFPSPTLSHQGRGEQNEIREQIPPLEGEGRVRVIMRFFHTFRGAGAF